MIPGTTYRTQRVTDVDLAHGRIRIPIGQKGPFPAIRDRVTLVLRGRTMEVAFDLRLGPDRERYDPTTGVLRSSSVDDIAAWFLDTAYAGESFFVRHAYFTPFPRPSTIKAINHYGDEVMKVFGV